MKKQNIYIIIWFLSFVFFSSCHILTQGESSENEGEREKSSIKKYFKENYSPQLYSKYTGRIDCSIVNELDYVSYDSISVILDIENEIFKNIFISGLISGQMLNTMNTDSITVCCFEELIYLKTKNSKRRFKFLVFHDNFMNPSVFLIELTNKESNKKTDWKAFIKGAELTFISSPWLQI